MSKTPKMVLLSDPKFNFFVWFSGLFPVGEFKFKDIDELECFVFSCFCENVVFACILGQLWRDFSPFSINVSWISTDTLWFGFGVENDIFFTSRLRFLWNVLSVNRRNYLYFIIYYFYFILYIKRWSEAESFTTFENHDYLHQ